MSLSCLKYFKVAIIIVNEKFSITFFNFLFQKFFVIGIGKKNLKYVYLYSKKNHNILKMLTYIENAIINI